MFTLTLILKLMLQFTSTQDMCADIIHDDCDCAFENKTKNELTLNC